MNTEKMQGMKSLQIGSVTLENPFILAPMAGVTDLPFRILCSRLGAGMVCMEMISAKAITYKNKATHAMTEISPEESVVSLQLFGSEPDVMHEAVKMIEEVPYHILDINMGCPVPKVVNNGEGSALMKNPILAGKLVEAAVSATKRPVTVKIRAGFDEEHRNAVEVARIAQESGAAAVAVHGRTRAQFYSGQADWDIIAEVKDALKIPVLGNGDVTDGPSAERMMNRTGCDGVLIGRAARGNPWIFEALERYFKDGTILKKPSLSDVQQMILEHGRMLTAYKGEYTAIREMRQHMAWYTTGYPNSAAFRRRINEAETLEALEMLVKSMCVEKD